MGPGDHREEDMAEVTKEVDAWLNGVAKLLKEHAVEGDAGKGLKDGVVWVLDKLGKDKLQQMDAADILVAVRNELPNAPKSLLVKKTRRGSGLARSAVLVVGPIDNNQAELLSSVAKQMAVCICFLGWSARSSEPSGFLAAWRQNAY